MPDEIMQDNDVTIDVGMQPHFEGLAQELEQVKVYMREMREDTQMAHNLLGSSEERMSALRDATESETEIYDRLTELQERLNNLQEEQVTAARDQKESKSELLDIFQELQTIASEGAEFDVEVSGEQRMMDLQSRIEQTSQSIRNLAEDAGIDADVSLGGVEEGGELARLQEIYEALEDVRQRDLDMTIEQKEEMLDLLDHVERMKEEHAEINDLLEDRPASMDETREDQSLGVDEEQMGSLREAIGQQFREDFEGMEQQMASRAPGPLGPLARGLSRAGPGGLMAGAGIGGLGILGSMLRGFEAQAQEFQQVGAADVDRSDIMRMRAGATLQGAWSPHIDSDTIQQIQFEAQQAGFRGDREFEEVTQAAQDIVVDFGVGVEEAMEMVELAIDRGDDSLTTLSNTLDSLSNAAEETGRDLTAMTEMFQSMQEQLTGLGVQEATPLSGVLADMFGDMDAFDASALEFGDPSSPFTALFGQQMGMDPFQIAGGGLDAASPLETGEAMQDVIRGLFARFGFEPGESLSDADWQARSREVAMLTQMLPQLGIPASTPEAVRELHEQFVAGDAARDVAERQIQDREPQDLDDLEGNFLLTERGMLRAYDTPYASTEHRGVREFQSQLSDLELDQGETAPFLRDFAEQIAGAGRDENVFIRDAEGTTTQLEDFIDSQGVEALRNQNLEVGIGGRASDVDFQNILSMTDPVGEELAQEHSELIVDVSPDAQYLVDIVKDGNRNVVTDGQIKEGSRKGTNESSEQTAPRSRYSGLGG